MIALMKFIIKLIDAVSHAVLIAFVTTVVLLAVISSLLRHYSPNINDYRQSLLELVNEKNPNLHIDAKELRSEWSLFQPALSLHDVTVTSGNISDDLHLKKLEIKVNFMKSLLKRELYFDYVELANLDVLLVEDAQGKWTFANIQNRSKENFDVVEFLARLWLIDELSVRNVQLSLMPKSGKLVQLPMMSAHLSSYRKKKQFVMDFIDNNKSLVRVIVNTRNKPSQDSFAIQAYVKFNDFPLAGIASAFMSEQQFMSGNLSNELWLNWKNKKLNITGRYSLDDVVYKAASHAWPIEQVRSVFYVDYSDKRVTAGLRSTHLKQGDQELILGPLNLSYQQHYTLRARTLDLQAIHYFLQEYELSEKMTSILDALDPRGRLKNVKVEFGNDHPLSVKAKLAGVSVSAWNGAPELLNVNGYVYSGKNSGYVDFDSKDFSLFFPRLYENPMKFDHGSGFIDWHIGEDTIYVSGKNLQLDAISGNARGEFLFSLPKVKSDLDSPRLSLNIGMKNSAAQYRSIFIPYVVSQKLTDWLDKNIVRGSLPEVAFIYHGPTNPKFYEHRMMQLWLKVKDASMTYAEGWPQVDNINGEYLMDDAESFAYLQDALSKGVEVKQVSFNMDHKIDGSEIRVQADVQASSENAHKFLLSKPLADKMGHVMDSWKMVGGQAASKVDVLASLKGDAVDVRVNASSSITNTKVELPEYNIAVGNVSGDIVFDALQGLSSRNLQGTFLGKPITSTITSVTKQGETRTDMKLQAQIETNSLAAWAGQPLVKFLSGTTTVDANIFFGPDGSGITFDSWLKGVQVNLPKPFAKKMGEARHLQVSLPFAGEDREVTVNYGQGVNSKFLLGNKGLVAGVIGLGVNSTQYESGKIILSGQLKQLNADEWMGVIDRYKKLTESSSKNKAANSMPSSLVFVVKNLRVKNLHAYDQSLDSVSLDLFNTVSYWQLGVNHKDLKATLRIYDADKPMDLHLQEVNLEFLSKKQEESGIGYSNQTLSQFPDINVTIDKLINNGEDYGEWDFNIRSYDDHMALEHVQGSFKGLRLGPTAESDAIMYWTFGADAKTYFKGKFVSDNIANVLKSLGYKQEVTSESAEFLVESWWDGGPAHFAFNNMTARCDIKLQKGSFADASSSSTDALKFIGVFNIANLVKRLKLDFSDLTSKGLAYDTIDGTVKVNKGIYQFSKPILVKSSTSKIRFYGGFDMNTEQLDVTMGVTLPLASNLPWIVALAAGLPTAAGVYIISKVMDKQVDQLSSAVYRVTGPFSEPVIKFDSLFDSEDGYEKSQKKAKAAEKPPT